ncbi:MAG: GTPase [Candidatus Micrarchaeota archaeon]
MASLNATPEYYAAEERYRQARTSEDKMAALRQMLALAPKHKGSQSILMEIKKKISFLRDEIVVEKKKKAGRRGGGDFIKKQGAAQVVLLGFVNSGKTTLLNTLCQLNRPSTDVAYETGVVTPGMLEFEKIQLQILDTPSITDQNRNKFFGIARLADLVLIILDPFQDIAMQKKYFEELKAKKMFILSKKAQIHTDSEDFQYDVNLESSITGLKKMLVRSLELIRVYTKNPRGETDYLKPFVMVRGSTVSDLAKQIHKEFFQNLKYARLWGSSKFKGQQVSADFILQDEDVVELHMK